MDEISQEPRRDFRLPPGARRWLTVAGVAGLVAAIAVFGFSRLGGHSAGNAARVPTPTASPGSQALIFATGEEPSPVSTELVVAPPPPGSSAAYPKGAPGTVVLSCGSAIPGGQSPGWRQWSLHAGPLWFPFNNLLGYVRDGLPPRAKRAVPAYSAASTVVQMIVEVAGNSRVVLKPAAGTAAYFRFLFLAGIGSGVAYPLPPGATGYTLAPCPAGSPGSNGAMTEFLLGFSIQPGRMVPVQVRTSGSARPIWLTFTAPTGQLSVSTGVSVETTVGAGG